jgi:hypothetical protein
MTQPSSLFCKYIKFSNGDNIVCLTDDNCDDLGNLRSIVVMEPMSVVPIRIPRFGKLMETYVLHPWLPLTDEKVVEISTGSIISAVEARNSFREQYEQFIEQQNQSPDIEENQELEIEEDLSRAQELLKTLATTEHEEDDDNDDGHWNPTSRTPH